MWNNFIIIGIGSVIGVVTYYIGYHAGIKENPDVASEYYEGIIRGLESALCEEE